MEKIRFIKASKEVVSSISKDFKVSERAVYDALAYKTKGNLSVMYRGAAMERGAKLFVQIVDEDFKPYLKA